MIDTGIRMQNAEVIPWIITGILFSTAIKISDTAEKYTSQYTVGRETFQVSGTLRDYLGIIGKERG